MLTLLAREPSYISEVALLPFTAIYNLPLARKGRLSYIRHHTGHDTPMPSRRQMAASHDMTGPDVSLFCTQ